MKTPIYATSWTDLGVWLIKLPGTRRTVWAMAHRKAQKTRATGFIQRMAGTSSTPTLKRIFYTTRTAIRSKSPSTRPKYKYSGEWCIVCRRSPQSVLESDHLEHRAEHTVVTLQPGRDLCRVQDPTRWRTMLLDNHFRAKALTEDGQRGQSFFSLDPGMYTLLSQHISLLSILFIL